MIKKFLIIIPAILLDFSIFYVAIIVLLSAFNIKMSLLSIIALRILLIYVRK